jgi:hypothetical protein
MLSTTASKLAGSAFVVLVSASGVSGINKSAPNEVPNGVSNDFRSVEIPVTLDGTSLLVATLASGDIEMQWMSRDACERVASAIGSGENVASVRSDGVRVTIARANCSTRRVEAEPTAAVTRVSSQSQE